jgi:hypothetical protein
LGMGGPGMWMTGEVCLAGGLSRSSRKTFAEGALEM